MSKTVLFILPLASRCKLPLEWLNRHRAHHKLIIGGERHVCCLLDEVWPTWVSLHRRFQWSLALITGQSSTTLHLVVRLLTQCRLVRSVRQRWSLIAMWANPAHLSDLADRLPRSCTHKQLSMGSALVGKIKLLLFEWGLRLLLWLGVFKEKFFVLV